MVSFSKEINETFRKSLPLPKAHYHILYDGKDSDKESEDERLVKGGENQGLLFKAATQTDIRLRS